MSDVLVDVQDIAKSFDVSAPWLNRLIEHKPRQVVRAVDGVSFTIRRGRTLALVGESGCGKSTVARLLVGLHVPTRGSVRFDGQDTAAGFVGSGARALRRRMQMIFQDPYASLNPRWTVHDIVAEPLREHGLASGQALNTRVGHLLQSVGLSAADMGKFPHQFSGGQRQRISIARALRKRMQMIFQDPYASLNPRWKVRDIVGEPLREHGLAMSEPELEAKVADLLHSVGMGAADMEKFPHQF